MKIGQLWLDKIKKKNCLFQLAALSGLVDGGVLGTPGGGGVGVGTKMVVPALISTTSDNNNYHDR